MTQCNEVKNSVMDENQGKEELIAKLENIVYFDTLNRPEPLDFLQFIQVHSSNPSVYGGLPLPQIKTKL